MTNAIALPGFDTCHTWSFAIRERRADPMQVIGQSAHSGCLQAEQTDEQSKAAKAELSRLTVPWRISVPISRRKNKVQHAHGARA